MNTLETQGEYLPRFTDVQSYISYNLSADSSQDKTRIGILNAYSRNRYNVIPAARESTFGTVQEVIFSYKGRLYFRKVKDSKIEVLAIGTKNTQARDLEFLDNL